MSAQPLNFQGTLAAFTVLIALGAWPAGAQPANDSFANRIIIAGTNVVVTGSNVGATNELGEPRHAGVGGGVSVWWSWTATKNDTATISTAGSSFDTVLGIYVGSTVAGLSKVADNDDDPDSGALTSKVIFAATAGQTYQIAVDGYSGDSGNVRLQVQLAPLPPPSPAAPWLLADPYGQMVNSTNFAGKVVMLDFWATWCGPCKIEMPDLVALQDKYRNDGLVIVGPDTGWSGDTAQIVQIFLATNTPALNYQIVMATAAMMQAYGGISAIPTTFIIDRANLIRKKYVGTQSRSTFEKQIIPLLYRDARLDCHRTGNQLVLFWPTNAATFALESATSLANPHWANWPAVPTVINGSNTVFVPLTGTNWYFRLRMPY